MATDRDFSVGAQATVPNDCREAAMLVNQITAGMLTSSWQARRESGHWTSWDTPIAHCARRVTRILSG